MRNVMLVSLVGVLISGCAAPTKIQREILRDPGRIDSITVGHFTTENPVDGEMLAIYLQSELTRRNFQVVNDSPYTLSGIVEVKGGVITKAVISLKKQNEQIVIWFYGYNPLNIIIFENRKAFAREIVNEIAALNILDQTKQLMNKLEEKL